jgi:hypothetical protein
VVDEHPAVREPGEEACDLGADREVQDDDVLGAGNLAVARVELGVGGEPVVDVLEVDLGGVPPGPEEAPEGAGMVADRVAQAVVRDELMDRRHPNRAPSRRNTSR